SPPDVRHAPSTFLPIARGPQIPPVRGSPLAGIPLPDTAASAARSQILSHQTGPDPPNKIPVDPPLGRRASETDSPRPVALLRDMPAHPYHRPAPLRFVAALRCLPRFAANPGTMQLARTTPSLPLPPFSLPGS